MKFNLESLAATALEIGAGMPAYAALLGQVKAVLTEQDQATLQDLLQQARARSDAEHAKSQSI